MKLLLLAAILTVPPLDLARGRQDGDLIRNWTFQLTEINPRTNKEEIVLRIKGGEARPIDLEKRIFEVRKVSGDYFTDPKSAEEKSERITFRAGSGRLDNAAGRLELADGVLLERDDRTTLKAPTALVLYTRKFECLPCGVLQLKGGNCPGCKKGLRDRTYTTVEVKRDFVLSRPDPLVVLTGEGLEADDALRKLTVARNGHIEIQGNPKTLAAAPAGTEDPRNAEITRLHAQGPLVLREPPGDASHIQITATGKVRIEREDERGKATVVADEAEIIAVRKIHPDTKRSTIVPERLTARGNVRLTERSRDREMTATAESIEWEHLETQEGVLELAQLTGAPFVTAESGPYKVRSRTVTLDRITGVAVFEKEVSTRLVTGKEADAAPVVIHSNRMVARLVETPAGRELEDVEALESVRIEGLVRNPGQEAGTISAERFLWNLRTERGLLEGKPFVRILQGKNSILAPKVVMEGRSILILKGPKRIRLSQPREDGGTDEYFVTSRGDIELNSAGARTRIILPGPSEVRTAEFLLSARRMSVTLGADGKQIESLLASGDVRARRLKDGITMYGGQLRYDPSDGAFTLLGLPIAVAESGPQVVSGERIRLFDKPGEDPGKTVRYTQIQGGTQGVRILIRSSAP